MSAPAAARQRRDYLIVALIVAGILGYGAIIYVAVGVRPTPDWRFGGYRDTPGESAYSTHTYGLGHLHERWYTRLFLLYGIEFNRMLVTQTWMPFRNEAPATPVGAVPVDGGEARYRLAPLGSLRNPLANDEAAVARGRVAYVHFCIQCHGSQYNGDGTVGQSFHPLPADLRSAAVQQLGDDALFRQISYGKEFAGPNSKAPPLYGTVSADDRWRLVSFIRSLGVRPAVPPAPGIPSGDFPGKSYAPAPGVKQELYLP